MKRFKDYVQHQGMLLPPCLEEMIGDKEMVRVVDRVIEELGHAQLLARFTGGGCPSFHPVMMLKVLVYAYSNAMYSSRQIAKALRRDISFMWLAGMQKPDFRTINRFRSSYFKEGLQWAFAQVVQFLKKEGYVTGQDYFIDGTSVEANAGKYSYIWRKCAVRYKDRVTAQVKDVFEEIERINRKEDQEFGGKDLPEFGEDAEITSDKISEVVNRINEGLKKLPPSPPAKEIAKRKDKLEKLNKKVEKYEKQIKLLDGRNSCSKTDTDSSFIRMKNEELRAGYNLQVGSENGFAVGFSVHQSANDASTLVSHLAKQRKLRLPKPKRILGDAIYGTEENYTELKRLKIENFLKYRDFLADAAGKIKPFSQRAFTKLDDEDAYLCPRGKRLGFVDTRQEKTKSGFIQTVKRYKCRHCYRCPLKSKCMKSGSVSRWLTIRERLNRFRAEACSNLTSPKGIELRKRRGNECEGLFADVKFNQQFRRFSLRGQKKVTAEAALVMLTHNIRKIALIESTKVGPNPT